MCNVLEVYRLWGAQVSCNWRLCYLKLKIEIVVIIVVAAVIFVVVVVVVVCTNTALCAKVTIDCMIMIFEV
jgi:hypothetical protein